MARGLKFRIKIGERLYYPFSENKDADQLRGYREADLRLCFSHIQKSGFLMARLNKYNPFVKTLAVFYSNPVQLTWSKTPKTGFYDDPFL